MSIVSLKVKSPANCRCRVQKNIAIASTGSPFRFRQSSGVCIVINMDLCLIAAPHLFRKRVIMPDRKIGRIDDNSADRIQGTRSTNANAFVFWPAAELRQQRFDGLADCVEARVRVSFRDHGLAALRTNFSGRIHKSHSDFRPTDIYSKNQLGFRSHSCNEYSLWMRRSLCLAIVSSCGCSLRAPSDALGDPDYIYPVVAQKATPYRRQLQLLISKCRHNSTYTVFGADRYGKLKALGRKSKTPGCFPYTER